MAYIEKAFPIEKLTPLARREANAKRPIAMLHKWWARRLGSVFRTILLTTFIPGEEWERLEKEAKRYGIDAWAALYYRDRNLPRANQLIDLYLKDKVVLDPFMGGGTTIVEALRLGCKVIGVDVNPVAWFITKKSIEPVDLKKLDAAFQYLKETGAPDILRLYKTKCPKKHDADVMYIFWVKVVKCANCGESTRLFNSFRLATKGKEETVFCPRCYWVGSVEKSEAARVVCPGCGREFEPNSGYSKGGKFICEHCGYADRIVDWVRRTGKAPKHEMFAIEYYCSTCRGRGYKGAEEFDRKLYKLSCKEFEAERENLPLPDIEVPAEGRSDPRPISFGMRRFTDLFNPRQLLCLGRLTKTVMQIEDKEVKESMLIAVSECTAANCMLSRYHAVRNGMGPLFSLHAYWVPDQPIENNVWGTKMGWYSFTACFNKMRRAVSWMSKPYEMGSTVGHKIFTNDPIKGNSNDISPKTQNDLSRAKVLARSAEDLSFIPSKSVDAVITDPPYYGNVQYAELSDFFYVWLRLALKEDYPEFNPPLVPKETEIVVNVKSNKTDTHFRQGLQRSFKECCRVLKDNGLMVFTFHHEKAQAWGAILDALLESGFDIKAVWTYPSESAVSIHRHGIRFDTVLVCRKRLRESPPMAWGQLKDEIVRTIKSELKRQLKNNAALSTEDIFVVTMGKALSVYSQHYPNIKHAGDSIRLERAIEDIEGLVDEQIDAYFGMVIPARLDPISRVYMQHLAPRSAVTRDSLVKTCRTRNIDFTQLEHNHYIKRSSSGVYQVLPPEERRAWLEKLIEAGKRLSPIDRAHYLYNLYEDPRGKSLRAEIPGIYAKGLEEVCDALYRITRDKTYENLVKELNALRTQGALRM